MDAALELIRQPWFPLCAIPAAILVFLAWVFARAMESAQDESEAK